jgi:hypothetical protein
MAPRFVLVDQKQPVYRAPWRHRCPPVAGLTEGRLKTPSPDLARRVALALGLPRDYFLEFREGFVIEQVKRRPRLREELYNRLSKRG